MSNQIQIRWNSGMSREDFQASREAIHNFPNRDAVTVSLGIKGELSEGDLDQILKIASRSDAEVKVTLTGTFEAGKQLRLFGPPENQTAMEVIQGRGERAGFPGPRWPRPGGTGIPRLHSNDESSGWDRKWRGRGVCRMKGFPRTRGGRPSSGLNSPSAWEVPPAHAGNDVFLRSMVSLRYYLQEELICRSPQWPSR